MGVSSSRENHDPVVKQLDFSKTEAAGRTPLGALPANANPRLVPASPARKEKPAVPPTPEVTASARKDEGLRKAHIAIHEKLWARNKTIQAVMSFLDSDGSGTITRDELVTICRKFHLMKYMDKMTKSMKGELTVDEVTTILDLVDKIGRDMGEEGIDGNRVDVQAFTKALFSYDRFANVIDILEIAKV